MPIVWWMWFFDGGFETHHSDCFFLAQEQLQRKLDYKVAQEYDDEVLESFHLVDACCWHSLISSPMATGKGKTSSSTFHQNFDQLISIDFNWSSSFSHISCRMVRDELWVVMFCLCLPRVQCNVCGKFESWSGKRAACLSLCKFWEVQNCDLGRQIQTWRYQSL